MGNFVQTITVKVKDNHEAALAATKRFKQFMESKGARVSAYWAIEAGPASGHAVISIAFPNAVAWAKLVDDQSEEMKLVRGHAVQALSVVSTALHQEVDL